jgi:hypothetical protein
MSCERMNDNIESNLKLVMNIETRFKLFELGRDS